MDAKARFHPHRTEESDTEDRVLTIDSESLGVDAGSVDATRTFQDLGADLLDRFALAMEIVRVFGLAIPDCAIVRFVKVGELVRHIENGLCRD